MWARHLEAFSILRGEKRPVYDLINARAYGRLYSDSRCISIDFLICGAFRRIFRISEYVTYHIANVTPEYYPRTSENDLYRYYMDSICGGILRYSRESNGAHPAFKSYAHNR